MLSVLSPPQAGQSIVCAPPMRFVLCSVRHGRIAVITLRIPSMRSFHHCSWAAISSGVGRRSFSHGSAPGLLSPLSVQKARLVAECRSGLGLDGLVFNAGFACRQVGIAKPTRRRAVVDAPRRRVSRVARSLAHRRAAARFGSGSEPPSSSMIESACSTA
jgi:hypothetical protein